MIAKKQKKKRLKKMTFILFGSSYSLQCIMMQQILREIKEELREEVNVLFYNIRSYVGLCYAQKVGMRVIPTLILFDEKGREYFRYEGIATKKEVVSMLKIKRKNSMPCNFYQDIDLNPIRNKKMR